MLPVPTMMEAWVARSYGGPEVLQRQRMSVPRVGPFDILVRIEASTVSSGDARIRASNFPVGMGWVARLVFGISRPRQGVLGAELTGEIVAVGAQVREYGVGQRVLALTGMRLRAHAQYCVLDVRRAAVRLRPAAMPLEVAAALAFGGTTALDYLERANLQVGERVLVSGAAGTVGSAIVQLAKAAGARVIALTRPVNVARLRALGADEVYDYTQGLEALPHNSFDIIADCVALFNYPRACKLLREKGRYLAISGGVREMLARPKEGKAVVFGPARERAADLDELVKLWERGAYTPQIDAVMLFESLPEAHAKVDSRHKFGSVVVVFPV